MVQSPACDGWEAWSFCKVKPGGRELRDVPLRGTMGPQSLLVSFSVSQWPGGEQSAYVITSCVTACPKEQGQGTTNKKL